MANTVNRGYPKPVEGESVAEEFYRLQQFVLDMIDGDVHALFDAVAGLAPLNHGHAIDDIAGLQAALDGKMPASTTFSLEALTDVSGADAAPDGYVLVKSAGLWVAVAASAAIGAHEHQSSDIVGLNDTIAALEDQIATAVSSGAVMHFARSTPPAGWLKANGAAVSRSTYEALFTAIGTTFGAGDGASTFNLPDLRGEFVRGWDDARGVDGGRAFGSFQDGQNESHTHGASTNSTGAHTHSGTTATDGSHAHNDNGGLYTNSNIEVGTGATVRGVNNSSVNLDAAGSHNHSFTTGSGGAHSHSVTVNADGGDEARPRNRALLACIKY